MAQKALAGVGDTTRGEWVMWGESDTLHLRRRLSAREQRIIGNAIDIRGTPEQLQRLAALRRSMPPGLVAMLQRQGLL